jgi:hypothetical protein
MSLTSSLQVHFGFDSFRPDYLHIAQARAAMGNPLTAMLTATATPQVQKDIICLLGLGGSIRIVTGFNRPNLTLDVRHTSGLPSKLRAIHEFLSTLDSGSAIIYTGTRRDAEEVTEFAREVVRVPAEVIHQTHPSLALDGFGEFVPGDVGNELSGQVDCVHGSSLLKTKYAKVAN